MKPNPAVDPTFLKPTITDVILIAAVLVLATASIVRVGRAESRTAAGPAVATIYHANVLVEEVALEVDRDIELADVGMRLEVREGRIRVVESDCPQQVCVHAGWIRRGRQVIACVPNKVLITIESSEPPFLDAIVH